MNIEDFNIHDILQMKFIWRRKHRPVLKDLDSKFHYFLTKDITDPDIVVEIGPFDPDLRECRVYERRFFVKEGFVYAEGGNWRTKWAIQISGLHKDKSFVKFNGKLRSIRGLIAPNMLVNILVLPLLELKCLEKGYMLLHSAAVSRNGNGYLIVGRGGSAKTSIIMDLIRKYEYEYVGDDRVLIGSNRIMSFPTHIQTFNYLLNHSENEFMNIGTKIRIIAYLVVTKHVKMRIADSSSITKVLFITPSTKPYLSKSLSADYAAKKMVANAMMEYFEMSKIVGLSVSPLFECFRVYSAAYPNSIVASFQEKLLSYLENVLSRLPVYEMTIPLKYDENVAHAINDFLKDGNR